MFSPVASTIFAYRNAEKTANGDVGRSVVTVGQCTGVLQEISKLDNAFAATAKSAVSVFEELAKTSKAVDYAGKCLKFTADNVNPLICASGALKVAMSDDKLNTGIVELAALSTMFTGEGLMKEYFNDVFSEKNISKICEKSAGFKHLKPIAEAIEKGKFSGKIASILKGVVFVGGSMASYFVGQKLGEVAAERVAPKKINQTV